MSLEVVEETLLILQEIHVTSSSNWKFQYQSGCSQFLISSRKFDSSICGWDFSISLGNITSFALFLRATEHSTVITIPFRLFCWVDLQPAGARKHIHHRICIPMASCNSGHLGGCQKSHDGFVHSPLTYSRHVSRFELAKTPTSGAIPSPRFFAMFPGSEKRGDIGVDFSLYSRCLLLDTVLVLSKACFWSSFSTHMCYCDSFTVLLCRSSELWLDSFVI